MTNDDVRELKHLLIDGFARIEKRLEAHHARFDAIERLLEAHDGRFDAHDARFDAIERRLEAHDGRFDAHDGRFDAHDGRFDALERLIYAKTDEMMEYTELKVGELRREMQAGFSSVDARFAVVDDELKRQRHLIATEFAKATTHTDRLFAVLEKRVAEE